MTSTITQQQREALAHQSLLGVSIGDALGESFFGETRTIQACIEQQRIPETSWEFTDDTVMAIAIYKQLEKHQTILPDELAEAFTNNHLLDVNRGYGATTRRILRAISEGQSWREFTPTVFDGMGSMGNGASMRVGPIGAYYFDDLAKVKTLAIRSAEITHSHQEGICGAIAVAIATAILTRVGMAGEKIEAARLIEEVLAWLPECDTQSKIRKSFSVPPSYHLETVKRILGNGIQIMAKDTVPFALWCAAHYSDDFEAALWKAIAALGDRDTIGAIIGGMTIMSSASPVPVEWVESVEAIETSVFW